MSGTSTLPTILPPAGAVAQAPADLRDQLVAQASALAPGLTTDLPGSLIEDVASTSAGAVVVIDQARVDVIDSLNPRTANAWQLNQLGQVYGVAIGADTNTSAFVVFSGPPGFVVPKGFVVTDGTFNYVVQDGGVIASGGTSQPISVVADQQGVWSVPTNSINQTVTSVPSTVQPPVTVTNPLAGTPGTAGETEEGYRVRVLRAGLAAATGMARMLKALITDVPGVQDRLVSVRQQSTGGWEVIVGGSGDPYDIGNAIFQALFDPSTLSGSVIRVTNVTATNPAVVSTDLNHGYASGQAIAIAGATGIAGLNNSWTATVIDQTSFSIPFNATAAGTYTGNGVVTPNFRNVTVNIADTPDVYTIPFVVPPQQSVTMTVTWNTTATNFVSPAAVAAAAQPAIAAYVNGIPVGQPINLFELQTTFQASVAPLIDPNLLTRMVFAVAINGVGVAPETGTGIIAGDPESYFQTTASSINVTQG